jgi:hypothetical protein
MAIGLCGTLHAAPAGAPETTEGWLSTSREIYSRSLDCSHFVHALYGYLGFDYDYAPSRELYKGARPFQRVRRPQSGDLIVWRGHVGVVVDAAEKTFISALHRGLRLSSYDSRYWKRKGSPRFYHMAEPPVMVPEESDDAISGRIAGPAAYR